MSMVLDALCLASVGWTFGFFMDSERVAGMIARRFALHFHSFTPMKIDTTAALCTSGVAVICLIDMSWITSCAFCMWAGWAIVGNGVELVYAGLRDWGSSCRVFRSSKISEVCANSSGCRGWCSIHRDGCWNRRSLGSDAKTVCWFNSLEGGLQRLKGHFGLVLNILFALPLNFFFILQALWF